MRIKYDKSNQASAIFAAAKLAKATGDLYYVFATALGFNVGKRKPKYQSFVCCGANGMALVIYDPVTSESVWENRAYSPEQQAAIV